MKAGYKVVLVLGVLGALYFAYRKIQPIIAKFILRFEDLSNLVVEMDQGNIVISNEAGEVVVDYVATSNDMEFPLHNEGSPYTEYDNVAKLQTFLVFEDIADLTIDGKFGPLTEDAVMEAVTDIGDYGYELEDYDFSEVTEAYYTEVVLPELATYIAEQ